jgi:tRNA A-37 threonylcarbamoyl transferase component Bud32
VSSSSFGDANALGDDPDLAETTIVDGTSPGAPAPPARLDRGTTVGRYVIIDVVGAGGMGVVYSAFDPELDRKVALKLLRPEARIDAGRVRARDRLLREAQAMAKLSHPNVLPVFDVGTYESAVFIALEFIDGETMRAWIDRTRPGWQRVLEVMSAAARGLSAAHAEGLVHRDFKPENVLLGRRGDVRVMDFGLARAASELDSGGGDSTTTEGRTADVVDASNLTKTGFVLGTPAYMAPEQHRGAVLDARADQFAFCVSLYEALYGERPFPGRSASEVLAAVTGRAVRPAPRNSAVPRWLRRVVLRGLAPDPADRWPSLDALRLELDRDRRGPVRIGALVVTTAAVAVAAGFAYGRSASADSPCLGHAEDLAEVWSDQRRAAIAAQFAATGLGYAADTWTRVETSLAGYVATWTTERMDACEASRPRREQGEAVVDPRSACLDRRRTQLDALLEVFASADAGVVERAVAAASGLDAPSTCSSPAALGPDLQTPSPEVAAEVERLRGSDCAVTSRAHARCGSPLVSTTRPPSPRRPATPPCSSTPHHCSPRRAWRWGP